MSAILNKRTCSVQSVVTLFCAPRHDARNVAICTSPNIRVILYTVQKDIVWGLLSPIVPKFGNFGRESSQNRELLASGFAYGMVCIAQFVQALG